MEALSRLESFIKQHALFHEGESVLLAVSGGRDSVLMAYLFASQRGLLKDLQSRFILAALKPVNLLVKIIFPFKWLQGICATTG